VLEISHAYNTGYEDILILTPLMAETLSTSNTAGSIKITMCSNVSQSAWFCIAPDCSMWWSIKENFDKCQSS